MGGKWLNGMVISLICAFNTFLPACNIAPQSNRSYLVLKTRFGCLLPTEGRPWVQTDSGTAPIHFHSDQY